MNVFVGDIRNVSRSRRRVLSQDCKKRSNATKDNGEESFPGNDGGSREARADL